ncbi:MAG: bifunctional hydroxymethylpyrimidine kinase/phosphomethylpyrimidine kinase [Dehalococcoidia bacterium]|nr:bifunctional hydroxymethylpyrimidine kinase/phosphomethylpyrimidine kinase [Dehalococcoidia bacterium]|tara:strand:- start:513 stop:1310 length:798 start_codon:yes stop_codon:yes gene_type:complete
MKPDGKILPICMTIAGSDSGGGAGIQADLKTFASLSCYGVSVVTSVTAQNTKGVDDIHIIPEDIVHSQIESIKKDIGFNCVKTGMIPETKMVETIVSSISSEKIKIVVDPVIVATSGDKLVSDEAIDAIKKLLFPIAETVTPNLTEAEVITGKKIFSKDDLSDACKRIIDLGANSVVIKGGHFDKSDVSEDILYDGEDYYFFSSKRINTTSTHGTGCTFSSAITSYLANGLDLVNSVDKAKKYVTSAIDKAYKIGNGNGPLNHFF